MLFTEMEIFIRGSKTDPGMQDLKEEAASQGLSEETVSTHGLRIGGATTMHNAGASTAVIQHNGEPAQGGGLQMCSKSAQGITKI